MPVGRCVRRTAESVTLTCWPPAPLERYVSMRRSLSVDLDVDVVRQLRPDEHRRERRVPARRLVERRDAHQPVDAGFGRQQAERVVAVDHDRGALDAGLVARLVVDELALEAAALAPAQVHAQQHLGPVLRLGAAGARVDGDDGVEAVVLAAEHLLVSAVSTSLLELVEALEEVARRRARRPRPTRPGRRGRRRGASASRRASSSSSTRRRRCSSFCASAWSFQKSGCGDACLDAIQFRAGASGVKDSSADRRRASRDPGSAVTCSSMTNAISQAYQIAGTPAPSARTAEHDARPAAPPTSHATTSPVRE